MNDVNALVCAIEGEPDDLTAVCALTDALMAERDMLRAEADRYAERVVQSARDARDMKSAAALLAAGAPHRAEMLSLLAAQSVLSLTPDAMVIIAPGDNGPQLHIPAPEFMAFSPVSTAVTVGARWLIRAYHDRRHTFSPVPVAPKRRRRPR